MAFERIKTVNGHKYRYLVKNVREDGKVKQKIVRYLGRIDKEPEQFLKIYYGFYYYAQDNCSACWEKQEVEKLMKDFSRFSGVKFPDIKYINLSTTENPLPINVEATPTIIECSEKGICICNRLWDWLFWKIGRDQAINVEDKYYEELDEKKKQEIKEDLINGMKIRALTKKHSDKGLIKECMQELEDEKKCKNGICALFDTI